MHVWFFSRKRKVAAPGQSGQVQASGASLRMDAAQRGAQAEQLACDYLTARGLRLLQRNYRAPGRGGGEIDLVMHAPDGTLVFVEVRQRRSARHGGAGASIDVHKQRRLLQAARHYLMRYAAPPPCRFDALLLEGEPLRICWLRAAFELD
jgi:putative endonuclease